MKLGRRATHRLPLRGSRSRSAYTLVELLLVLAILGLIAAAAWPSVLRMQADHDLSAAMEDVRQQLGNARTWAIHSGLTYQFRFEPNGQRFCVIPFEAEQSSAAASNGNVPPMIMHRSAGAVAKKLTFLSVNSGGLPPGQKIPNTAFQGLPNAGELAGVGWSGPLVFTPEGTRWTPRLRSPTAADNGSTWRFAA